MIQRLYSAQAQGEITFTLTYLLQLRLCFGELFYQLRICFVPGSVSFEESEKHPLVQEMLFFPREQTGFLAEHLVCKNVQPWLRVSFASTSQPSLYLVPYSQETPAVTGKFGLGIWNEPGQRLIEFCRENALVIANTHFQQHKRRLYTWISPDGQHRNQIDYILCSKRWTSTM